VFAEPQQTEQDESQGLQSFTVVFTKVAEGQFMTH